MSDPEEVGKKFCKLRALDRGDPASEHEPVSIHVAALMTFRGESSSVTPIDSDFGLAARFLQERGIRVFLAQPGDVEISSTGVKIHGFLPTGEGWIRSGPFALHAVFNRLPARSWRQHEPLLRALAERLPVGNPPAINELALDKLTCCQRLLAAGLSVPEVEGNPARFARRLDSWGAAYLKPRWGSFGCGVRRIDRAVPLDGDEEMILQRAIDPPAGPYAGLCIRGFVQRGVDGRWRCAGRVARISEDDPVANVARGARGIPLASLQQELDIDGLDRRLDGLEQGVIDEMLRFAGDDGSLVVELGLDWVLDGELQPWLVEVNGKPGGRLRVLASLPGEQGVVWRRRQRQALIAPFEYLASLVGSAR